MSDGGLVLSFCAL